MIWLIVAGGQVDVAVNLTCTSLGLAWYVKRNPAGKGYKCFKREAQWDSPIPVHLNKKQVDLNYLFLNKNEVFADWFTGDIRIPQSKMLKKVNLGYESIFEKNRIHQFREGVFKNETVENQYDKD